MSERPATNLGAPLHPPSTSAVPGQNGQTVLSEQLASLLTMDNQEQLRVMVDGVAAILYTAAEMGHTDDEIRSFLVGEMTRAGFDPAEDERTRQNMMLIAESIRRLPQPPDESAEEREQRRPIEDMLGIPSAEDQLNAQLRAQGIVLEFASRLL